MGSVWCKPSEMRQDCSPKLNIHSLISRLSSQMCPSKCRYPQTTGRSRTKPRPRSAVLSQGKRPDISPPLAQPIPPPRKKRKRVQDFSRSEEILCPQETVNSSLRASMSLPSVYDPNNVSLRNAIDIRTPMASIKEESTNIEQPEINETETDSLPPSEVYFLKKEEIPVVFSEANSVAEITEKDEYLNNIKPMNDTFSATSELNLTMEKAKEKEEIIKNETKRVTDELHNSSDDKNSQNKLNFAKDQSDIESIKKWQDTMKTKWLQRILVDGERKDPCNQVTVNGCLRINTSIISENKSALEEKNNDKTTPESSPSMTNNKNSSNEVQNDLNDHKINENIKTTDEYIPKLLVTQQSLCETLEKLQNTHSSNQDVHNNRNLVYSSENLIITNSPTSKNKIVKDLKHENRKENLKLDVNLEEILHSNRNSRHSSITDSLQEFETSIYDMLQQSAKENASDEDDSLVLLNEKNSSNNKNNVKNSRVETAQIC